MPKQTKAYLALIFICIVWGTTYLAIRVGVLHFPAFLFAAIRQVISGIILIGIALGVSRKVDVSISNILHHALVGFLLITLGNGLVTWGEKSVPSGVAAIICSLMPIVAILINLASAQKEKLNSYIIIGMLIGFGGVGLIFKNDLALLGNKTYIAGSLAILVATSSWALGSVLNKKRIAQINPLFNAGLQLLFGGIFLFIGSPLVDNYKEIDLLKTEVLWSMLYLILFGSVLAYTAYMYALKQLPVGIVTLYAYVNPLVAVAMGYWLLNEPITIYTIGAFVAIMVGVYVVNYGYKKEHTKLNIDLR